MRALKLQKENFVDDALSLFNELLETEVLFEVSFYTNCIFYRFNCNAEYCYLFR